MNDTERKQVVELLRCAARMHEDRICVAPIFDAAKVLGYSTDGPDLHPIEQLACDAIERTRRPCSTEQLLEAAARVESGEWP